MNRRTMLACCGTVCGGILAGCGGDGDDSEDTPADGDTDTPAETATQTPTDTGGETPTATETDTPTDTPMATETDTPTPESTSFTHELGEEFTVGEGGERITYRILELSRADEIGSQANFVTADGTFLIVTMEVTNPRDVVAEFPWRDFRLQTADAWRRFDREPSQKVEPDDRIDVEYIGDDTFPAGASKIGAVVADVDPEVSYRIWITPAGDADTPEHFVPVGDFSAIEELGGY